MSTPTMALVRYHAATGLASQRLTGPVFTFLLAASVTQVSGGGARPMLAETAAYLFPVTAWLAVIVFNSEPLGSTGIIEAAAGGPGRVRIAKGVLALAIALVGAGLGLASAAVSNAATVSGAEILAGAVALFLTCVAGVAFGSLCSRPVLNRPGWVLAFVLLVSVLEVAAPLVPPVGAVNRALEPHGADVSWPGLALAAAGTALVVAVCTATQAMLARRRG